MTPRHARERRNNSLQKHTELTLDTFSQQIRGGQESRDVMTEFSSDVKVPTTPFVRRRYLHVPHAHQVAERIVHTLFDSDNRRRVGDVSNLNVNRIDDDEHRPQRCKSGTGNSSSLTCSGVQGRSESCRQKSVLRKGLFGPAARNRDPGPEQLSSGA